MNYIVTGSGLEKLPQNITKDSVVFLLYKAEDSVLFRDIAALYESEIQIIFIPIETKEDALICVGSILARTNECEVLSEELSASTSYLQKISKVFGGNYGNVKMAVSSPKADVEEEISSPKKDESASSGEYREASISAIQRARRASEKEIAAAKQRGVEDKSSEVILSTKNGKALYDLIHVCASDVGFSLGTEPLMQAILSAVSTSKSDRELKNRIEEMTGGQLIWKQMQSKLAEIRKIVGK